MKGLIKTLLREYFLNENNESINYEIEHLGSHSGQHDYELGMYVDGEIVGLAQYTLYENELTISNIFVRPEMRRRGYGSRIMVFLKQKYPEYQYKPSMKTDLGSKFIHKDIKPYQDLNEDAYRFLENELNEDYPSSFNMDEFKKLKSFNQRINYCEENLQRISSGSSRIVYKIDDEKVLKLAKNKKGLAQNEVESEFSGYYDISDIVARVFDVDPDNLWIEMELARKLTKGNFKQITGFNWEDYVKVIHNYSVERLDDGRGFKYDIDKSIVEEMWENEFTYEMLTFIGSYDVPIGDLKKISTYGVVKRGGQDSIVMIDYGLTSDVYDSYYS
jgi:GNAT superfamily N-acetyltransferase